MHPVPTAEAPQANQHALCAALHAIAAGGAPTPSVTVPMTNPAAKQHAAAAALQAVVHARYPITPNELVTRADNVSRINKSFIFWLVESGK